MAISEEKQNLIRTRIMQGISIRDIAKEACVSKSTVEKYKKKMPEKLLSEFETGDNEIIYDNRALLTKLETRYTKKIADEIALYEDPAEGWVYHLTKDDYQLKTSGLWWVAIAYPESVEPHWQEELQLTGLSVAISPLHDKDIWKFDSPEMLDPRTGELIPKGARYKAGDRKKAHWHIILVSDTRMSAKEINELIRPITNGPYLQKCRSLRNAFDYFLHINAPDKYQGYDKTEIKKFNNFHIEPNKYETGLLQNEILETILEKDFINMHELIEHYIGQPEYITILASKPALFSSFINSRWKKANPEGRVNLVKIVTENYVAPEKEN